MNHICLREYHMGRSWKYHREGGTHINLWLLFNMIVFPTDFKLESETLQKEKNMFWAGQQIRIIDLMMYILYYVYIYIYIIFSICNKKSNERTKVPIEGSQNIIKNITVSQTAAETMWSPTEEDERWLEARITLLTVALPVDDLSQIGAWIPVWRCLAFNVWV